MMKKRYCSYGTRDKTERLDRPPWRTLREAGWYVYHIRSTSDGYRAELQQIEKETQSLPLPPQILGE